MSSILNSIKKLLGIDSEFTAFDDDLIIYINGVFSTLFQLGIGPSSPFSISDKSSSWDEFLEDYIDIESVKTYIYLKVKMVFDPPTNGALIESIKNQIQELEWRFTIVPDFREEENNV